MYIEHILGNSDDAFKELNENNESFILPNNVYKLKHHQLVLLHKCILLENTGLELNDYTKYFYKQVKSNIGIIADKVGSGKSFVILSLIQNNTKPLIVINDTNFIDNNYHLEFEIQKHIYSQSIKSTIIVVQFTLVKQWSEYVNKYYNKLAYTVINSNKSLLKYYNEDKNKYDIIFVTERFYRYVADYYISNNIITNRIVFDEVDNMSIPSAKRIPSHFYWFVSASYMNVVSPYFTENINGTISTGIVNNIFVKNIFASFIKTFSASEKTCLNHIILKNENQFVDKSFNIINEQINDILCIDTTELRILKGIINTNIIQSLNAGDIKTALSYLNPSNLNTNEKDIIILVQNEFNVKITNVNINIESIKSLIFTNEQIRQNKLDILYKEKKDLETKMTCLETRISEADMCIICLNPQESKTITKCCKSSYCFSCISKWLINNTVCPMCKSSISENDLYVITDLDIAKPKEEVTLSSKYDNLRLLISKISARKYKILIFSEYDNSFDKIKEILDSYQIKCKILKGNGTANIIHDYVNDKINVLLVNSNHYGSGLNLQMTTDIIIFHKMDYQMKQQVIGRAQRPGRTQQLQIWQFLYENEL